MDIMDIPTGKQFYIEPTVCTIKCNVQTRLEFNVFCGTVKITVDNQVGNRCSITAY